MTEAMARELYEFLVGERLVDYEVRAARARPEERDACRREGGHQDAAIRDCAAAFVSMVLRMFPGIPAEVLQLRQADGAAVDPASITFSNLRGAIAPYSPRGFSDAVPTFDGRAVGP